MMQIELKQAIILVNNGYTSLEDIVKEDPVHLLSVLMDRLPWKNAFCEEDEVVEIEDEWETIKWIEGVDMKSVFVWWRNFRRWERNRVIVCLETKTKKGESKHNSNCVAPEYSREMKFSVILTLIALCVSVELPHKYMAMRGFDVEGNVIKSTGNKNVVP